MGYTKSNVKRNRKQEEYHMYEPDENKNIENNQTEHTQQPIPTVIHLKESDIKEIPEDNEKRDMTPEDVPPMYHENVYENANTQNYQNDTTTQFEKTENVKKECYTEHIKKKNKRKRSGGWAKLIAASLIIGISGGAAMGAGYGVVKYYGNQQPMTTNAGTTLVQKTSTASSMSVVDVVRAVKPSVVSISTKIAGTKSYQSPFGLRGGFDIPYEAEGAGSGVIFYSNDSQIAIATNNHVIEGANEVFATINDNTTVRANVVGTKADSDLAVLTISWKDLKAAGIENVTVAQFGNSDNLQVGESVIAIGNAMGLGLSATDGIVSIKEQNINVDGNSLNVIQTSAAINSGNSGGALVNTRGEVIGINTAKYNSSMTEGMGYAIPSNDIKPIVEELLVDGTSPTPYIGIVGTSITAENASLYKLPVGALIMEVTKGGPADLAGIQAGDIITNFDGKTVMDMDALAKIIKQAEVGAKIPVHIIRNGQTGMDLTITIADKNQ